MAHVEKQATYDLRELTHSEMVLVQQALYRYDDMLDPGSHERSEVRGLIEAVSEAL